MPDLDPLDLAEALFGGEPDWSAGSCDACGEPLTDADAPQRCLLCCKRFGPPGSIFDGLAPG